MVQGPRKLREENLGSKAQMLETIFTYFCLFFIPAFSMLAVWPVKVFMTINTPYVVDFLIGTLELYCHCSLRILKTLKSPNFDNSCLWRLTTFSQVIEKFTKECMGDMLQN